MRITIHIDTDNDTLILPLSYHHQLQALIYKMIGRGVSKDIHNNQSIKSLVFSQLKGEFVLDKEQKLIVFSGDISFSIASSDDFLLLSIVSNLISNKKYDLLGQKINVVKVVPEENIIPNNDVLIIEMMSPVTVHKTVIEDEKNKTVYFNPDNPEFNDALNKNYLHKIDILSPSLPKDSFQLFPYKNIKKVNILYKGFTIISYMGLFIFKGKKEQLSFLLDNGLGDRNPQGFGMFRIVNMKL